MEVTPEMSSVLSVVVPIYNVEPYLDECLSSIAAQYHRELDVVMVDDGSTDDSAAIAAAFAARDSRFRLISQANAGLGAARNAGAAAATGDYLMFVDSDDVIPPYCAEVLIASLATTGSDFACGNVMRLTTRGVHQSGLHRNAFEATRLRTHVSEHQALLDDRTAWNKVFQRRFWDAHKLRFPEGVLYEDTPVIVPAHVLAKSVDVLEAPVYYWREREGVDKSITQRRDEVRGFVDRLAGVEGVSRFLGKHGQHRIKRLYDTSALKGDLWIFMKELPKVDAAYQQTFLDGCNTFLDSVDERVLAGLPTVDRVLWTMVRKRMLPEMLELIPEVRSRHRIVRRGLRRYHEIPFLDDELTHLPRSLFLAGTPRPRTKVHDVDWRDGKLVVRGHSFIPGQAAPRPWSTTRLIWLRERVEGGRQTKRLPLVNRRCVDATGDYGSAGVSYDWSGFEATIDPQLLRDPQGQWQDGQWAIVVGVVGLGQKSKGSLEVGQHANPVRLRSQYLDGGVRITPIVTTGRLRLEIEHVRAMVTGGGLVDGQIQISGRLSRGVELPGVTARLSRAVGVLWRSYPVTVDGDRFTFRVPAGDLEDDREAYNPLLVGEPGDRWAVELAVGDDTSAAIPLAVADDFAWEAAFLRTRSVIVHADGAGHPVLSAVPAGPVLTGAETTERGMRLWGGFPPGTGSDYAGFKLVLRPSSAVETRTFPAEITGDTWTAEFDPLAVPIFGARLRLRAATWNVLCRTGDNGPVLPLPAVASALDALPLPLASDPARITLEWLFDERTVLRVRSALAESERGKASAHRMRTKVYPELCERPLRDAVLFNSFTGRQYSDSPRAVHEEMVARGLPLDYVWVSGDGQAPVPDSARAVDLWTRGWYEAMATSRYIVTNQHLPEWFCRREGQVVVQTWHGTPLKRIGFDIADLQFADRKYLEKLATEAGNWSHLVSPNSFSTPILRRAFRYSGEMLEIGYPRNDILFADRDTVGARVRAELGLPAGKRVVLYAPTWRDDEFYGNGRYKITMHLDLEAAAAQLGDDHVLLIRRHPNVVDEIVGAGNGFVFDVSAYPDMADLLAVTDVLITDYSSVMFDFANTGRPMLFFTYDLAHYRDKLRGFYFDFEQEAPGPLLSTSQEVVAAIRDIDAVAKSHTERYTAFAARACDLDDGRASARLVDHLLAAGGGRAVSS